MGTREKSLERFDRRTIMKGAAGVTATGVAVGVGSRLNGGGTATFEFAQSTTHKLHRDGKFYDLTSDPFEEKPLGVGRLTGAAAAEAKKLQAVLDEYASARPVQLARHVAAKAGEGQKKGGKAGKKQ